MDSEWMVSFQWIELTEDEQGIATIRLCRKHSCCTVEGYLLPICVLQSV